MFVGKLKLVLRYIVDTLRAGNLKLHERYVFLRDQAFFKLQYFSCDRANYLGYVVAQEVKRLPDYSGLWFFIPWGRRCLMGR